ncbi:PaaI family thioesterase [Novosphingopyxis sp.]|uniref:PaaI family thioesterase n=1 Tax=Novosphingopyxis sp. TaxID=2709690 RepID=UPI003B5C29EF
MKPPTIFDDLPLPPAAQLLGWSLVALDPQAGTIEVEFDAKAAFTNPSGHVQGGFLAAMLDDTLGPAAFAMTGGKRTTTTIDLHLHFVRPVQPGRVTTRGRVVNLGARIAFLEGELFGPDGRLAATASASAMLVDYGSG